MSKLLTSTKVMDALDNLGLNSYERKIYVTLIAKGVSTAGALSEQSTVPRSRCYDVLESLIAKGFVIMQNTKPVKYVAVKPSEALDSLKKKHEDEYQESLERIERMKKSDSLKELEGLFKDGIGTISNAELNGSIKGRHVMHQHLESAIKKAKKTVSIMTSSKGLEELAITHIPHMKKAADRGVKIKIMAPVGKDVEQHARSLSRYAEIKHSGNKGRLVITDGKEVMMALTDDTVHPSQDMHFWTQSDHISSEIMQPMFDGAWKNAKSLN